MLPILIEKPENLLLCGERSGVMEDNSKRALPGKTEWLLVEITFTLQIHLKECIVKLKLISLQVHTTGHTQFIDITAEVNKILKSTGIIEGICYLYVPHTTAGITINENADPSVQEDMIKHLEKIIPREGNYKHVEGNSAAHIKSSLLGNNSQVFISEGKLVLGTWQGILFCEFDGPRTRNVYIKTISA